MKLLTPITANQLTKGMKSFAGQEVTNPDKPHVVVKINSTATSIEEGMWLVEYTDGTKEIWNTEQIKSNTDYKEPEEKLTQEPDLAEDVRIDDETPKDEETETKG